MRIQLNPKRRSEILLLNNHLCCVCGRGGVQIHHINSDSSDNRLENLAVLCLDHHDKATSPKGLSASLKPEEIKTYKERWEKSCEELNYKTARSRTAFFMVDYKNAERIRQLYAQLTKSELLIAYEKVKNELIEEDPLRESQGFDVSIEPNTSWKNPYLQRLVEEIPCGSPHPEIFVGAESHPLDPYLPASPAFADIRTPLYDIWCQIMIRCLIATRKTYDINTLQKLTDPYEFEISGSLVVFNGRVSGDVEEPSNYKEKPVCHTTLKVDNENTVWLSQLSIKTHYVYSYTAAESLSDGRSNGVLLFRSIDEIKIKDDKTHVKFFLFTFNYGMWWGRNFKYPLEIKEGTQPTRSTRFISLWFGNGLSALALKVYKVIITSF